MWSMLRLRPRWNWMPFRPWQAAGVMECCTPVNASTVIGGPTQGRIAPLSRRVGTLCHVIKGLTRDTRLLAGCWPGCHTPDGSGSGQSCRERTRKGYARVK
eukprot:364194-Chlamydomonas_euryale.AAC.2